MFVDYDGMTVDQMLEKQIELKRKVAQAHQSGMSPGLIAQMQNMLDIVCFVTCIFWFKNNP